MKLIQSEAFPTGSKVHLAKLLESRGIITGRVYSTYYVKACDGRKLGGAWGANVWDGQPQEIDCARCAVLAKENQS